MRSARYEPARSASSLDPSHSSHTFSPSGVTSNRRAGASPSWALPAVIKVLPLSRRSASPQTRLYH